MAILDDICLVSFGDFHFLYRRNYNIYLACDYHSGYWWKGKYVWIVNLFLLSSTVVQPSTGQLADIFGRRWPMLISVALFIFGSGIGGGAHNVEMLIAGRTVQGIGCGGAMVMVELVICDMVSLRERGKYVGLLFSTGAIGSIIGPVIGGAIAEHNWVGLLLPYTLLPCQLIDKITALDFLC